MVIGANSLDEMPAVIDGERQVALDPGVKLMNERAAKLAAAQSTSKMNTNLMEVITFIAGGERCCLEACFVHEIIPFTDVTRVPGVPDFMVGVINLHGQLVALLDLRRVLGLKERQVAEGARVIVIGKEKIEFSILVDSVESVASLDVTALLEAPEFVSGIGRDYIRGVTSDAMTVFDGSQLIDDPRLFVNQSDVQ